MCFFDELIYIVIIVLFPAFVYLLYVAYINNSKKIVNQYFLDLMLVTSIYLLIRFNDNCGGIIALLIINIPLIISYLRKRFICSIIISIMIIIFTVSSYNLPFLFILFEYLFYIIFFTLTKNIKKDDDFFLITFMFVKGIVLSFEIFYLLPNESNFILIVLKIFLLLLMFYLVADLNIKLLKKGEQLLSLNKVLKELEQEKKLRDSLFKITHEIKNPIAVCKGYLDMMDLNDKEKISKYVPIIKSEISRTLNLMDDFLNYTKIKIVKEELDLTLLLDDTVFVVEQLLKKENIKLITNYKNEEIYINGDYNKLKQVLINIIKNSIEAIDHNNGIIDISLKNKKNKVFIIISDNGCGMESSVLEKVKDAFYTTKKSGTGLGVSLSNEIILAHNGSLEYFSLLNKGTKVIITLRKDCVN